MPARLNNNLKKQDCDCFRSPLRLSIKWLKRAVFKFPYSDYVGQGLALAEIKSKITFIEKWLERSVQATFGAFRLLLGGSELCKAQETRGSKFTCEFGRNSTVYCFVASDN